MLALLAVELVELALALPSVHSALAVAVLLLGHHSAPVPSQGLEAMLALGLARVQHPLERVQAPWARLLVHPTQEGQHLRQLQPP